MKFKSYKNKLERPFYVSFDGEACLVHQHVANSEANTKKLDKHVINSCCFNFICTFDSSRNQLYTFRGSNCLEEMVKKLTELSDKCIEEMKENKRMRMTHDDSICYKNANCCYICGDAFTEANYKVRDHDHRTGEYRGAAHTKCNINYFSNRFLPVVCHNLRGYDSHLIIEQLYKLCPDKDIQAIPTNFEKFMSFKIGQLKFIDSFQFMGSSLEKLTEHLYDKDDKYKHFHNMKKHYNEHMDLLCRKGYYPYEYIENDEQLDEISLPPKEAF
jgi:hypothetical protein